MSTNGTAAAIIRDTGMPESYEAVSKIAT